MLLYGMTVGSLKYRLNKTEEEAKEITDKYWNTFPRIQPFLNEVIANVTEHGRVRYWSGRIWRESNPVRFYKGCNAQIQGGAADVMTLAIMRAHHILTYNGWGSVISIVHDEILTEVKTELVDQVLPILVRVMEVEDIFGLPFRSEAKIGKTYGNLAHFDLPSNIEHIRWQDYCDPNFDIKKYSLEAWTGGRT